MTCPGCGVEAPTGGSVPEGYTWFCGMNCLMESVISGAYDLSSMSQVTEPEPEPVDPMLNEVYVDDLWGEKPQWQHDCGGCTFQGKLGEYDLYTCHDSFLARYGNDGPEYLSAFSLATFIEAISVRQGQDTAPVKPCPGCAEKCGQCNQEALD